MFGASSIGTLRLTGVELEARRIATGVSRALGNSPTETWVVHRVGDPGDSVQQVSLWKDGGRRWVAWTGDTIRASQRQIADAVARARNRKRGA